MSCKISKNCHGYSLENKNLFDFIFNTIKLYDCHQDTIYTVESADSPDKAKMRGIRKIQVLHKVAFSISFECTI